MENIIDVSMNEIKVSTLEQPIIGTSALTTCVGFLAYSQKLKKALVVHYTFDDELATNMLCNEAGYYVKNIANNVEYTTTSAAVGTQSIYCTNGL
jgi:hypothetical protein